MKNIVFYIEQTDNSKEMIRYAALFAKIVDAKVHILYIQNPQFYSTQGSLGVMGTAAIPSPIQYQKNADEAKETIKGFIKEIEAELSGIPSIQFESYIGDPSVILKEKVENKTYDLVMLQGYTEVSFFSQNPVIMDIVRNVPCPIYIIPPEAKYQPLKKIIYATDYNEEDITTLKSLISLAKSFDPEIIALHISDDDKFEKKIKSEGFAKMLDEKTAYNKISVKMITDKDGEDAVESLIGEAERAKANLIVVLKENRNFFERLFKSSFTAELVKETQLPILVFQKAL